MENAHLELCQNIVSGLIVPALGVSNGRIVAANKAAYNILPVPPVGRSVYELFPEAKTVSEYSCKCFDAVSLDGICAVNVSSVLDFELWQLTPSAPSDSDNNACITKNEVALLFSQINLLQHNCPNQTELFSSIYKSCCKLLKSTAPESDSATHPILYVFDLAKEAERFIAECSEVFCGLNISVDKGEFCRFTYVCADRNILDSIFAGLLCLCAYEANPGGGLTLSVSKKDGRALLSFAVSPSGEEKTTAQSEDDKILTKKILQSNLSKLNAMLFSVSDGKNPAFIVSFPVTEDEDLLYDYPLFPSVGIPAHLIQLSSLLTSEFYSELN